MQTIPHVCPQTRQKLNNAKLNRIVATVKSNNPVVPEEIFFLINYYPNVQLMVNNQNPRTATQCWFISHYQKLLFSDWHEFSQAGTDNVYRLSDDVIAELIAEYHSPSDDIRANFKLTSGERMTLTFYKVSQPLKYMKTHTKTDVFHLQESLDAIKTESGFIAVVQIADSNGLSLSISAPHSVELKTEEEEIWAEGVFSTLGKLHINDQRLKFVVSVDADTSTIYYKEEEGGNKEFIVRPTGQPFMEIKILIIPD